MLVSISAVSTATQVSRSIDSLQMGLAQLPEDTVTVNTLLTLQKKLINEDSLISAFICADKAAALSKKIGWKKGMSIAATRAGDSFFEAYAYDDAVIYYRKAYEIAKTISNHELEYQNLYQISDCYARTMKTNPILADSELYYKQAAMALIPIGQNDLKYHILNEIAGHYYNLKNFPESILLWKSIIHSAGYIDVTTYFKALLWNNLAGGYLAEGNYDSAHYAIENCMGISSKLHNPRLKSLSLETLADYFSSKGKNRLAISFYMEAIETDTVKKGQVLCGRLENIALLYEKMRQYDSSLFYYKKYLLCRDNELQTNKKTEASRHFMRISFKQQIAANEQELEVSQTAATNSKRSLIGVISIALLLLSFTIVLYKSNKQNVRHNKIIHYQSSVLEEQKNGIQQSLDEKEILLREIHHRVKNNLQVISSLLSLQLSNISDIQVQQAMMESNARVSAIALIHQQLYQNESLILVDIHHFTQQLFEQVSRIFNKDKGVEFLNNIGLISINADDAMFYSLIINELFTNSFKYAFDNVTAPEISIAVETGINGYYTIIYKDNGPGLPPGIDFNKAASLGMKLLKNLSKKMSGTFTYDSVSQIFYITFKEKKKMQHNSERS